uniref:Uncharacterized protein n=1 Tax=Acanthochromis polyacanthus TaxID=80966 RepID=A0A3Q1FG98_9TELE
GSLWDLRVLGLFVADLISSVMDWFQTKPEWAKLEVLEDTELKTTGGGESQSRNKLAAFAKTLWEKTGAVVMVVRRPE